MTDRQTNKDSKRRAGRARDPQITGCATGYLGPLWRLGAPLYMETNFSPPLRLWLRALLRPSFPLSLRGSTSPEGDESPPHRRLRALRFADIPTPLPVQNIKAAGAVLIPLSIFFSAPFALDACATTSALARQRFCITSATGIALLLVTPPPQSITGFAALRRQLVAGLEVGVSWKAAARLRLPEATAEVLASLGEHRILSTAQVRSIHFPDRSVRRAQQVLAYLERAGLVAYIEARRAPRHLWFLTERGADYTLDAGEVERRPNVLESEQAAGPLQAHTLGVNEVGISFLRAARERGDDFGPLSEQRFIEVDRATLSVERLVAG